MLNIKAAIVTRSECSTCVAILFCVAQIPC